MRIPQYKKNPHTAVWGLVLFVHGCRKKDITNQVTAGIVFLSLRLLAKSKSTSLIRGEHLRIPFLPAKIHPATQSS